MAREFTNAAYDTVMGFFEVPTPQETTVRARVAPSVRPRAQLPLHTAHVPTPFVHRSLIRSCRS